jgi:hypothetical protein
MFRLRGTQRILSFPRTLHGWGQLIYRKIKIAESAANVFRRTGSGSGQTGDGIFVKHLYDIPVFGTGLILTVFHRDFVLPIVAKIVNVFEYSLFDLSNHAGGIFGNPDSQSLVLRRKSYRIF